MGLLATLVLITLLPCLCFAPPLPLRSSSASSTNPATSLVTEPTPEEKVPAEESEEEVRPPATEKVMRATLRAAHTPAKHGRTDGPYLIAQRTIVEDYCGWGWVRKENQSWRQATWIAIEGTPNLCPIPHTFLPKPEDDKNQQYRFYGEFAPYRAYEPQADMWVDVFILKGFMSMGPAEPIRRAPPPKPAPAQTALPSGERICSSLDPKDRIRYCICLMREQVILECTEARAEGKPPSRYFGTRNKKLKKERIELRKFNPFLRRYTLHREKK